MQDTDLFYQAALAKDSRFDGCFFLAVKTTGIYCRPVCPARKPKRQNVEFFPTAAAAEGAGFRACLRCRPETAPGTPAWSGTSTTVARALRLMATVALEDESSLTRLAERLGLSDRRLRQLFQAHLGASPIAVLSQLRLDFARRLLDETSLPMAEVAFCAGFSSVRRFNEATKRRFGQAPTALRQMRSAKLASVAAEGLSIHLPYRPPYDWTSLLSFLRGRAIPGVEQVSDSCYRRTISIGATAGHIAVSHAAGQNRLHVTLELSSTKEMLLVVERLRALFDLSADPLQVAQDLGKDELLRPMLSAFPGLRVPGAWDGFELAVRAVLGQQVSVKGATTLCGRLIAQYGTPTNFTVPGLTHLFPHRSHGRRRRPVGARSP